MEASAKNQGDEPPAGPETPAGNDTPAGPHRAGPGRVVKIAASVTAGILALGLGFGLTRLIDPSRAAVSDIPLPAKSGGVFVEDDNGTGQDSESNIFQATAPGLVHVTRDGQAVGIGLVLTRSGKVLTTYQPPGGTGGLGARYVLSGKTYHATILGADPAAGLALLQMQGGGRAFPTVQVGNSRTLIHDANHVNQLSYHLPGEVSDTAIGTAGTQKTLVISTGTLIALDTTVKVGGKSLTGLMKSVVQSSPATEIGGPLVNLNGQVIGITLAGSGSGVNITNYAMPINQALAVARQLDLRARHTS